MRQFGENRQHAARIKTYLHFLTTCVRGVRFVERHCNKILQQQLFNYFTTLYNYINVFKLKISYGKMGPH